MKIYSVTDAEFLPYGRVIEGVPTEPLIKALQATPLSAETVYMCEEPLLQQLPLVSQLENSLYGGMPVQLGWCNGHNTKLNCLEYHRDSEFNLGTEDFILLLAKQEEIKNNMLDTAKVKAFYVAANVLVEIYATTLHYAPCQVSAQKGFRVMVALPKGTNTEKPMFTPCTQEDSRLWARNKWLLAHPQSNEAVSGAVVGLTGNNIDLENEI
ncbi:MAG: DUF4867 family protein [Oscillospiraceae bacterium]|nr:DUF4867 family protein [Oscillospiraceae bacterium]